MLANIWQILSRVATCDKCWISVGQRDIGQFGRHVVEKINTVYEHIE